jgi:predicted MPP superfamily phosphohydrolase
MAEAANTRRGRGRVVAAMAGLVGAVSLLVLALQAFTVVQVLRQRRAGPPANLSNRTDAGARLPLISTPAQGFGFAVVGDINRGIATFRQVMARVRAAPDLSFLVLLGDCANDPTREAHDYFREEFVESGQELPTFIVAGNHDLAATGFTRAAFEQLYGPSDFSFTYGNCLFIGLGTGALRGLQDEALTYLERTLAAERAKVGRVFVLVHFPPMAALRAPAEELFAQPERFIELFDRYQVDYVISGHHHQLTQTQAKATTYLISGGGGARLRDEGHGQSGLFHHAIVFRVSGDLVDEQVLAVPAAGPIVKYLRKAERGLTRTVWPWEVRHPALALSANLAALLGLLACLHRLWGQRRRSFTQC